MWSSGRSEAALEAELPVPIVIRPLRTARRMRLRFDDTSGVLRLTCPVRTNRHQALAWALAQRDWIEAQLARVPPAEPFESGAIIPIEGVDTRLEWDQSASRVPEHREQLLRCGGPREAFGRRVATYLKQRARDVMSVEVAEYAAAAGVAARSVSVGDAATRWGSCSSQGAIRLNWRLILAPPQVRRYVVAHEVAHLIELNHGPRFHALEARLFGSGVAEAKAALRRVGPRLRRIGRGL